MDPLAWLAFSGTNAIVGGMMVAGWIRFPYHLHLGLAMMALALASMTQSGKEPKS